MKITIGYRLLLFSWLGCISVLFFNRPQIAAEKEQKSFWPIEQCQPLPTHWSMWMKKIICLQNQNELHNYELVKQGYKSTRLYRFNHRPDIIRHFPLKNGDLIVAISNSSNQMIALGFDRNYNLEYENTFDTPFTILDAQVRIDSSGSLKCLFYSKERQNNILTLWRQDVASRQILVSEHPIEKILYHEEENTIHLLKSENHQKVWMVWQNDQYRNFPLNRHFNHPTFFIYRNMVYLLGVDPAGTMWKSYIKNNVVISESIVTDDRLRLLDEIILFKFQENINMLAPIAKNNIVLRYNILDFEKNLLEKNKDERFIFHAAKIHPVFHENQLSLLLENELNYVYFDTWNTISTAIINFEWRLDLSRVPSRLVLQWQIPQNIRSPSYNYVLDQNPKTIPLDEQYQLKDNRIEFENPADGKYVFHLRLHDKATNSFSPLYHIPIYWQYVPPEPRITLLNRVTPIHIDDKPIQFLIDNFGPFDYFAEVNEVPGTRPEQRLEFKDGLGFMNKKLEPGLYYIHIRAKDRRSLNFSTVYSERFFIWPFTSIVDCNTDIQAEVTKLLYRKNRSNDDKEKKEILQLMKTLYQKFLECKKTSGN